MRESGEEVQGTYHRQGSTEALAVFERERVDNLVLGERKLYYK